MKHSALKTLGRWLRALFWWTRKQPAHALPLPRPTGHSVIRSDPAHFTARALRASAAWQVWCAAQFKLRHTARESYFHGDHPIAELRRFGQQLASEELRETYARCMLQNDLDWLVSGLDHSEEYHSHLCSIWGPELAAKLRSWYAREFETYHSARIENHVQALQVAQKWPGEQTGTEVSDHDPR